MIKVPSIQQLQTNSTQPFPWLICACCDWGDFEEGIALDHVFGDGKREREEIHSFSREFIQTNWLEPMFPNRRYQFLCHTCNHMKGTKPLCIHQRIKMSDVEFKQYLEVWTREAESSFWQLHDYLEFTR